MCHTKCHDITGAVSGPGELGAHADDAALHLVRNFVDDGGDHAARPAPWRPEIDHNRLRGLQDQLLEVGIGHLDRCTRGLESRASQTCCWQPSRTQRYPRKQAATHRQVVCASSSWQLWALARDIPFVEAAGSVARAISAPLRGRGARSAGVAERATEPRMDRICIEQDIAVRYARGAD
jgi:hypothetical protein